MSKTKDSNMVELIRALQAASHQYRNMADSIMRNSGDAIQVYQMVKESLSLEGKIRTLMIRHGITWEDF